ncbi:NAD-dependent epimerase/dehydratase family protein [Frankia sp. Cr2]|uniref:NAD-dependent epimerase/dehydratase family protein n=1 Tax=Frankia sp. Cr2 TaxID=3073932 RepID=UPI002AD215C1|nr:NAD-dependent epimerase/dehydratase family protein [Frankia sp. Cr2]
MRITVTGGSGFIGAHLVDRLLDAGHDVISVDLHAHVADPRADHRIVDVLDLPSVTSAFAECDMVFHLAGMANVDHAFADPIRTVRLNVEGTANVCEAARITGVRRVLFASTVWVYGASGGDLDDPQALTEAAEFAMNRAGHVYTSTKIAAELLLHSYQQTYGVDFTILRYGIPYGPGMREELVLARFLRKAIDGEPLTVAGDGQQFRNYVFVRDLADAHVLAMDAAARNETIALEGDERVSVLAMAQAVRDHFPGVEIEHIPARPGDFRGRSVSNAKAEALLGWRPTTRFADGVRQYVEWYLADRQAASERPVSVPARRADGVGVPASAE